MKEKKVQFQRAIGLKYLGNEGETPSISLNEDIRWADEAVKIAKRFGVPVIEKPSLVEALRNMKEDQEIPENLFETVAILLHEIENKTTS